MKVMTLRLKQLHNRSKYSVDNGAPDFSKQAKQCLEQSQQRTKYPYLKDTEQCKENGTYEGTWHADDDGQQAIDEQLQIEVHSACERPCGIETVGA